MGTNLDILQHARALAQAVASADRQRRVAALTGLNVLAVALAFGALHIGGILVSGSHPQPLIAAIDPKDATPAAFAQASPPQAHPLPVVPFALAAVPDADVLFAAPLLPASFGNGGTSTQPNAFVTASPAVVAESDPPPAAPPAPRIPALSDVLPSVSRLIGIAELGRDAADQLHQTTAPLVQVADGVFDTDPALGVSAGVSATAGLSGSVSSTAAGMTGAVASTAAGVTGSVAGIAGGAVGAVGHAVGGLGGGRH